MKLITQICLCSDYISSHAAVFTQELSPQPNIISALLSTIKTNPYLFVPRASVGGILAGYRAYKKPNEQDIVKKVTNPPIQSAINFVLPLVGRIIFRSILHWAIGYRGHLYKSVQEAKPPIAKDGNGLKKVLFAMRGKGI